MSIEQVSIVLPVYNQADHVGRVVDSYAEALARIGPAYELVLVPNGCRDGSLAVCEGLSKSYPARVVDLERGGWGRAVRAGLAASRGDLLCYTNLARTSAQDLTLLILYALANPGTVVKANRKLRDSVWRRVGGLLYNLECRTLFDLAHWDVNGTPKVFPRQLEKLLELTRDDDLIDLELSVVCQREGYSLLEVPILSANRHGGRSTTNLRSAIKMYLGAYWMYRSARP